MITTGISLDPALDVSPRAARAIAILADLIGFETVSHNSNLALIGYVEELLRLRGIAATRVPDATGGKASLFASIGPDGADGVVLSAHSDVVPVDGQSWTTDPFVLTQQGDRLIGRGTADMKGFVACALAILEQVDAAVLRRPLHFALSYDEEVGCIGAPALIARLGASIARPAAVIVGEPSSMRVVTAHKSVHLFRVTVTGKPAHSSTPTQGVSATAVAVRLMATLLVIADRCADAARHDARFEPPFTTLTIGTMRGGTAGNIIAADAEFVFDLRCLPGDTPDDLLKPFRDEISALRRTSPDAVIAIETLAAVPSLAAVADDPAERIVRSVSGDNAPALTASYAAEAGQFQQAGYPTVICGPGSMEQGHQPDEFIAIGEIERCMAFLGRLVARLGESAAG